MRLTHTADSPVPQRPQVSMGNEPRGKRTGRRRVRRRSAEPPAGGGALSESLSESFLGQQPYAGPCPSLSVSGGPRRTQFAGDFPFPAPAAAPGARQLGQEGRVGRQGAQQVPQRRPHRAAQIRLRESDSVQARMLTRITPPD